MTSRVLIRQLAEQTFAGNFHEVPVAYQNVAFKQDVPTWVEFAVETRSTKARTVGRGLTRTSGQVKAIVHFPVNTGMGDAWKIADKVGEVFDSQTFPYGNNYLRFGCASSRSIGRVDAGYGIEVTVPFEFDGDDR